MNRIIIAMIIIVVIFFLMKKPKDKKLGKNFTLSEFSTTGEKIPIDVQKNLERLVTTILQPIRDYFGKPVHIVSGYRSPVHNKNIGGVEKSDHIDGNAADFYIDEISNQKVIRAAQDLRLPIDQIIDEEKMNGSRWIHISYGTRGQILQARDNELTPGKMSYELIGYLA